LLFALVGAATGSNRYAILSLVVLFSLGAAVLGAVDVERGERAVASDGIR